ncbi:effector binding domain-containing protein [Kingella kingae]|uniref:effector binding domain-containing protein n=2 Tax=Kingella kingae TaxID=504 RepID=UPI0004266DF9|nr:effector binding domain-containing protein [Kingella kingae]MDK4536796.1 effector binding domain-containing protein [Kingella kingae]MDK4537872.1 effector binding domain-containing protein [Kingella kingae]MDK4546246.1 effector binding domain-containing protein [Kingella kingae]MDK4622088.1 effector binding domain-containing protein [Kingella kingae]
MMNTTTLPVFRVAGLAANIRAEHAAADLSALWQSWQQSSLQSNIHAFSRTIYCVYHQYQSNGDKQAVLGYLVPNDLDLPDATADVWVLPQQYAVYELPDKQPESAWTMLTQLPDDVQTQRANKMDLESYPSFGLPKIYVGLVGQVEMTEEAL